MYSLGCSTAIYAIFESSIGLPPRLTFLMLSMDVLWGSQGNHKARIYGGKTVVTPFGELRGVKSQNKDKTLLGIFGNF